MSRLIRRLRRLPAKLARSYSLPRDGDVLVLHWARQGVVGQNWGDKLNPVLARMISGKNVVHAFDVFLESSHPIHYVIGSSLEHAQRKNGVVWGVGFITHKQGIDAPPAEIHAVRGHRSVERLRVLGIPCPDVVGDPALLLPRFYSPQPIGRRFSVGIIPHCYELDLPAVRPDALPPEALLIDITGDIFDVVDQVNACDEIISSSLHGLICAEAYGVPSTWVRMSDRPVGDGFKYHDYFSSVGREADQPVLIQDAGDWAKVVGSSPSVVDRADIEDLCDRLLAACPFWPESRSSGV